VSVSRLFRFAERLHPLFLLEGRRQAGGKAEGEASLFKDWKRGEMKKKKEEEETSGN